MIFPLFLFIAGVSLPFSIAKRMEKGETRRQLVLNILRRTALLFFLGLIYCGLLKFKGLDHLRIMGVLQRQALGFGGGALILLYAPRPKHQVGVIVALLLAYWAMMSWIPVPGATLGSMTQTGNLANYIDRVLFKPGQLYTSYGDPEGLFSTIPAIATALLGVLAGQWLRSETAPERKAKGLFLAGLALVAGGYMWGHWFPIIKKIWTSSYVLVAGGGSLLLLALFYWLIDVKGYRRWTLFFVVIGVNPLTIYLMQAVVNFDEIAKNLFGGALAHAPYWQPILFAASVLALKWLLLRFLARQKIYLRA